MIEARFQVGLGAFSLDVDLALPSRGVVALTGPSGSGKTTLLRCIAGLERAARGRLRIDGEIWQDERTWLAPHRRPIGYVFQEASLFPHLSVLGNLRYGLKRARGDRRVNLEQAVALLGIGHLLDRRPDRLSGGERQRVAIARALAVGPRLLLMDEPLAALDPARKREVVPYLERLHDELRIPLLYVSHVPEEVAHLADHLVVLDGGRVRAHGPLPQVSTQLDLAVRLGEEAGAVIDAAVSELDAAWHLAHVSFPGGGLWVPDPGLSAGRRVRVRVLARDVSLAREHPGQSSIQNVLRGRVDELADGEHPGLALARIDVGGTELLARLTRRAAATLALEAGLTVWVQVKSVALMEAA
jgi:molybdate transport system ATP-binding protein